MWSCYYGCEEKIEEAEGAPAGMGLLWLGWNLGDDEGIGPVGNSREDFGSGKNPRREETTGVAARGGWDISLDFRVWLVI